VSSNEALQAIADQLQMSTGSGRTTIRVDVTGDFFPVAAETLTPGARSFRDYSMAWVEHAPTPIYDVVSRERVMLVQTDCESDERPPPREIIRDYGVRAQMLAPVVRGGRLIAIVAAHELSGPRQWSSEDIAALELAVEQTSNVLGGDA
jgi:GAF domain-containing protein